MSYDEQTRRFVEESAKKRIEQSLASFHAELQQTDLNINVFPLKDKLEEWHFNIWPKSGKFASLCIHGTLEFPREYPMKPPNIEIMSPISTPQVPFNHPCVMDVNHKLIVKLPMLQSKEWNPTTPVMKILTEMSQILNKIPGRQMETEQKTIKQQMSEHTCIWCGHCNDQPVPAKGLRYGLQQDDFIKLMARVPSIVDNDSQDWRDARIVAVECSFARVYFEAQIVRVTLNPKNVAPIRVGWTLKETFDETSGECEYVALGNRYFVDGVASYLIHKVPYSVEANKEQSHGFSEGDSVVCAADFEGQMLSFFINGKHCVSYAMPSSFIEGTLVPYIGTACAMVKLNFSELSTPIPRLSKYLTVEEMSHQNKGQYLWDTRDSVDWMNLFRYGGQDNTAPSDSNTTSLHNFVLAIFKHLTPHELAQCHQVCGLWNFVLTNGSIDRLSQLHCFYSKEPYSKAILGMMLQVESGTSSGKKTRKYISKLRVSSDYISLPAWSKLGIRIDSVKTKYTHFLPLVINTEYGEKALVEIKQHLASLTPQQTFSSRSALDVIAELLNATITSLNDQFVQNKIPQQRQIKHCLSVWSCLHHLLLFLHSKYPEMTQDAEEVINTFITDPESRNRGNWPHLGKLLMYLLVVPDMDWNAVSRTFIEEHLCRDVASYITTHKQLEDLQVPIKDRLQLTFAATEQSRRLLMLQFTFLVRFGKPPLSKLLDNFNHRYGGYDINAPKRMEEVCLEITKCKNWIQWFQFIWVNTQDARVNHLLKRALFEASRKGYVTTTQEIAEVPPLESTSTNAPRLRVRGGMNGMAFANNGKTLSQSQGRGYPGTQPIDSSRPDNRPFADRNQGRHERFSLHREERKFDENRRRERGRGRRGREDFQYDRPFNKEGRYNNKGTRDKFKHRDRMSHSGRASEHAGKSYPPEEIKEQGQLPTFIQSGLNAQGLVKWKPAQEKGLPFLTLGKDTIILSPAGSGKATLLAIVALYRLYVKKDPAHVIIMCGDDEHCQYLAELIWQLGTDVPDLLIECLSKRPAQEFNFKYGRNIFIGTPSKICDLCSFGGPLLTDNLTGVYILDCDAALSSFMREDVQQAFRKIPSGIHCSLFSNSWCATVAQTAKLIVDSPNVIDMRSQQRFYHWSSDVGEKERFEKLVELCTSNPLKTGIIWCSNFLEAKQVCEILKENDIASEVNDKLGDYHKFVEDFANGRFPYLICYSNSPTYLLWKTQSQVMLMYNLRPLDQYSKRIACTGVTNAPVHVLSLVSQSDKAILRQVEEICSIEIKPLQNLNVLSQGKGSK